jgi:hypothetical protein
MARLFQVLLLVGIVVGIIYTIRRRNRYRPPGD